MRSIRSDSGFGFSGDRRRLWKWLRVGYSAVALTLTILALGAHPVAADDADMAGVGGGAALVASEHPTIAMVSEVVRIDQLPAGHVRARFVFKNSGPACRVRMGFPAEAGGDSPEASPLQGFHSWVDGKRVTVRFVAGAVQTSRNGYRDSTSWYVKPVDFTRNQTRVIEDEYTGGGSGDSVGGQTFIYVLRTGASWHGPIGDVTVIADVRPLRKFGKWDAGPYGYRLRAGDASWHYTDLKPTGRNDIQLSWKTQYDSVIVNGVHVHADMQDPAAPHSSLCYLARVRGGELWLPAALAASWLGATLDRSAPDRYRITLGKQWVDVQQGSATLTASSGKRATLPYPAGIESVANHPEVKNRFAAGTTFQMVGMIGVVHALGGQAHFDVNWRLHITLKPAVAVP